MVVRSNARLAAWLAFVVVLSALNYLGRYAGGGDTDENLLYKWSTAIANVIQALFFIGLMFLIARGLPTRAVFALRRPGSWGRALGLDVAVFFGMLVLFAAISPFTNPGEEQGLIPEEWDPSRAAPFVANAVAVIVFAPVSEELTFRGLGFSVLARFGTWPAILLVGLTFGLVHGLAEGLAVLIVFGTGLAYIRARTESIYPTILLHAVFNAFALIGSVVS